MILLRHYFIDGPVRPRITSIPASEVASIPAFCSWRRGLAGTFSSSAAMPTCCNQPHQRRSDNDEMARRAVVRCRGRAVLGGYVPVVHRAAFELKSNLRTIMFVGAAYFIVAVLIPAFFIFVAKSDPTVKLATVPIFICTPRSGAWLRDWLERGLFASSSRLRRPAREPPSSWRRWCSAARQSSTRWRRSITFTPRKPHPTGASSPVWFWRSPDP